MQDVLNKLHATHWRAMWLAAAAFNFIMGLPITFFPEWSFSLTHTEAEEVSNEIALMVWRDFGILVLLIGVGYYIVARDVHKNHGLAVLGILAKLFDVVTLTLRWALGLANPIVLIPAAIDGLFAIAFVMFLVWARADRKAAGAG